MKLYVLLILLVAVLALSNATFLRQADRKDRDGTKDGDTDVT